MQGTICIWDEINNRKCHLETSETQNALNCNFIVGGDLEKALDCVNHDILLQKLETYGITGKDKELYPLHLKGRYQRVLICNKALL